MSTNIHICCVESATELFSYPYISNIFNIPTLKCIIGCRDLGVTQRNNWTMEGMYHD